MKQFDDWWWPIAIGNDNELYNQVQYVLPNVLSQSAAKLVYDVISKMAANADIDSFLAP